MRSKNRSGIHTKAAIFLLFIFSPIAVSFVNPLSSEAQDFAATANQVQVQTREWANKGRAAIGLCLAYCPDKILPLKIQTTSGQPADEYSVHYFKARNSGNGPKPLVLVPPLPDFGFSMDWYCSGVSKRGMNCAYVKAPVALWNLSLLRPIHAIRSFKNYILENVAASENALNALLSNPDVDSSRLGVMGVCLSGFEASLIAQEDPRVKNVVLLISGGNFPLIAMKSRGGKFKTFLSALKRRVKFTSQADMKRFLEEKFRSVDPISHADRMAGRRVLMINSNEDPIIPIAAANDYAAALNKAGARITYKTLSIPGHNPLRYLWDFPRFFKTMKEFNSSIDFFKTIQ